MKKLVVILFYLPILCFGQTINFPDTIQSCGSSIELNVSDSSNNFQNISWYSNEVNNWNSTGVCLVDLPSSSFNFDYPYIAYRSNVINCTNGSSVGFPPTGGANGKVDIKVINGVPYIAYTADTWTAYVYKYQNGSWVGGSVGGGAFLVALSFKDNDVYLATGTSISSGHIRIYKNSNNSGWSQIASSYERMNTYVLKLAIDTSGNPIIAYSPISSTNLTTKRYNVSSNSWQGLGGMGYYPSESSTSLIIIDNIPYLSYFHNTGINGSSGIKLVKYINGWSEIGSFDG